MDGPDDILQIAPQLLATPDCTPAGFHYQAILGNVPDGAVFHGQWRAAPAGAPQDVIVHTYAWRDVTVDCLDLQLPPNGRTEVTVAAEPTCAPDTGIDYAITATGVPNGPTSYEVQVQELGGQLVTADGQAGVIGVGEGTFEVRGVLHLQGVGFHASDWVEVVVDCPDDEPGDDPRPEDEPEDEPQPGVDPDDVPRPGTPTFTG